MHLQIIVLVIFIFICIIIIKKSFLNNKKEEGFANLILTAGLTLTTTSFGTNSDKLLRASFIWKNSTTSQDAMEIINKSTQINFVSLFVGLGLTFLAIALKCYVKNKLYILNINGYFDKRIENHHNDLSLSAFEFKEREVNFIRTFKKGINKTTVKDIVEEIKERVKSYKNESKEFKRGYTGIAPIPFIMLAGAFLKREEINEYFEFDKTNTQKYYKLKKLSFKLFGKKYPKLKVKTNISQIDENINEIVLAIEITSPITNLDLAQFCEEKIVRVSVDNPSDNTIRFKKQLIEYTELIYDTIEELSNSIQGLKKIHLIYAGQSCLALELGKIIDDNRMPQIVNYQYNNQSENRYPWGIIINGQKKGDYEKFTN